jgi:uncharacterized protein with von Willebrand factor type A (vWA) domain
VKVWRYSRWDGTQPEFSLDADAALGALSDLLMEGLTVAEALAWMQQAGFELAGVEMRVLGADELLRELRREIEGLEQRHHLRRATEELERRFRDVLDREQRALERAHGHESRRMNDFLARRHAEGGDLADAIERFRDHAWADEDAEADWRELLDEVERLRALERFRRDRGARFSGPEAADYPTAQAIRERIEALEGLARDLAAGRLPAISPEELGELLGEDAARSLVLLRDLRRSLERAGYLREGAEELTPRAIRRLGAQALAQVYGALRRGRRGAHETPAAGASLPRPDETRAWEYGDGLDLDAVRTLLEGVLRHAREAPGRPLPAPLPLAVEDFRVRELDHGAQTTTVLLLDMSWSMSWSGRFAAAKRVALALDHLIRTRFPRDRFFVVGFYTRAVELGLRELPESSWNMGDPFTNLQEGLMVAERLIARHPSPSPQVLVVTDGQPTAYFVGRELRVEWPTGVGGISPRAAEKTLEQVRRITRRGVTINTFMLDDAPELVGFVERMTKINRGRAFFTTPRQLGSYLMVDYLSRRSKRWR